MPPDSPLRKGREEESKHSLDAGSVPKCNLGTRSRLEREVGSGVPELALGNEKHTATENRLFQNLILRSLGTACGISLYKEETLRCAQNDQVWGCKGFPPHPNPLPQGRGGLKTPMRKLRFAEWGLTGTGAWVINPCCPGNRSGGSAGRKN
jgi:hypothetical protein